MGEKPEGEQRVVFGIAPRGAAGADLLLAISPACWDYMKDGKTHALDLSSIGVPIRVLLFGCADRAAAIETIEEHNKRLGLATLHLPKHDFGPKPAGGR